MSALIKMEIEGFKDSKYTSKVGSSFKMQINPSDYSLNYKTTDPDNIGVKADGDEAVSSKTPDVKNLILNFTLDSTGVVPGCESVPDKIDEFNKICTIVNGEIHTTNYLAVVWGQVDFLCKLESLQIDYQMFSPDGIPVRAKLGATFKEHIDPETSAKRKAKSSPDMSHIKIIKAGDSLPSLCNDIYGDSKYYLQVAEINGLLNFRTLVPGQAILFPRMQK